jgi:hypothetical protein
MGGPAKTADEILGVEYDWLARDMDDRVGLFSTAGGGYAPPEFLRDPNAHQAAIDAVLALPVSTTVRFAPALDESFVNTWRLVAERGLFAFDADPNGGPYQLVAAPDRPAPLTDLPVSVADVVSGLQYRDLRFAAIGFVADEALQRG